MSQFNQANDVDMICRAHQLVMEGYKWHFNETVLTVWSAPNYCYRCGNVAAILELDEHLARNFTIFEAAPQEARGCLARSLRQTTFCKKNKQGNKLHQSLLQVLRKHAMISN